MIFLTGFMRLSLKGTMVHMMFIIYILRGEALGVPMYSLYNSCRALQLCDVITMATDADSQCEVYWPVYVLIMNYCQIDLKRQNRCNFCGSDMSLKHINIQ